MKKFSRANAKKVKELVPELVSEKAASLNPLNPKSEDQPSLQNVPKITNENITEHREEVLKGARKYIYPLQHSKYRIVTVTLSIVAVAIIGFLIYCAVALYRTYQYNTFVYRITQVVPFPIAKTGGAYVDYENYLFELRHYVHYYQTQQQRDFTGQDKQQLILFRKQALNDVIGLAYVKKVAHQHDIGVSDKEVSERIDEVRSQNRLGSSNKVFEDVLRNYWGWSINDFKRSLKDQILTENVTAALDPAANQKASAILTTLKAGADFGATAKQSSDDPSAKDNGGDYGGAITKDNPNISPQVIEELFKLKPGQTSGIIDAGATLEIVKVNQKSDTTLNAQHISINLKPLAATINKLKTQQPAKLYVKF